MRPKQYSLERSQKPEVYNLQDLLPRITYSLFLYHRDNLHQHLRDRFLPQDRFSFALFFPGILAVQSSSTHPTSVTNAFHRFNLRYGPGLPRGPRVCGSPRNS
jgi:hypothetical protein